MVKSELVTISARIPKEQWQFLKEKKINISAIIRMAIAREIQKFKEEELKESLDKMSRVLKKIPVKTMITSIREDRDQR